MKLILTHTSLKISTASALKAGMAPHAAFILDHVRMDVIHVQGLLIPIV